MSDRCAWCGSSLPPDRREAKSYRQDLAPGKRTFHGALCSKCEDTAKNQKPPWTIINSPSAISTAGPQAGHAKGIDVPPKGT